MDQIAILWYYLVQVLEAWKNSLDISRTVLENPLFPTHINYDIPKDIAAYGLIREVEQYELTKNVRFAFVDWVGENIHRIYNFSPSNL